MQWNISYIDAMGFTFRIKTKCTQTGRSSRESFGVLLFQQSLPLSNMDIIIGHRLETKGGIPWTLMKFLLLLSPTVLISSPHLHPCGFHAIIWKVRHHTGYTKLDHKTRWWVFVPKNFIHLNMQSEKCHTSNQGVTSNQSCLHTDFGWQALFLLGVWV